jgi:hypothetical protein
MKSSMDTQVTTGEVDEILSPFLQEENAAQAERLLAQLVVEHADPIIEKIIRSKLHASLSPIDGSEQNQNALEVRSDVHVRLIAGLRSLKAERSARPIRDFRGYVAVVAYNACSHYLRQKYPRRHSLKNRVRYVLTHQPGLSLWEDETGEWLCGFIAWRGRGVERASAPRLEELRDSQSLRGPRAPSEDYRRMPLAGLLKLILAAAAAPVELDDLVNSIADLQGIKETLVQSENDQATTDALNPKGFETRASIADEVGQRLFLKRLWTEISQLPPKQRAALLLNLRDAQSRDVIVLFQLTGVATIPQIAEALEMTAETFAELWGDLPLDDLSIAKRLGITRQQVINLRKSARERLARRMRDF